MAIRFRCSCGALFEVSEETAGQQGRCRRCGSEMTIPRVSDEQTLEPPKGSNPPSFRNAADGSAPSPPFLRQESAARFCPFCGTKIDEYVESCPFCFRQIKPRKIKNYGTVILTPVEWLLVTVLAPLGFLGGFVNLVLGNRKGLHMIGISTLSMLMMWIVLQVMNWLA